MDSQHYMIVLYSKLDNILVFCYQIWNNFQAASWTVDSFRKSVSPWKYAKRNLKSVSVLNDLESQVR